jgi:hypothetical protein
LGWSKRGDTIVEETYLDDSSGQNTYLLTADASALAGLLNTIEKIAIEGHIHNKDRHLSSLPSAFCCELIFDWDYQRSDEPRLS